VSNAVKFTSAGAISVRIDVADEPGAPSRLSFEVRDTGTGFDAVASDTIFQRFSQADTTITRRFGGTGLGLAICKSLVEMMGGDIAAESEPGRGSLFRVVIPLARSQSLAEYDLPQASSAVGASAFDRPDVLRILLAEDHPINQRVVQLILAPYGVEIVTVGNGAEAVEAFAADRFDLVLMDMQMPVMDGLSATRAIRAHEAAHSSQRRTPVIMLSANAMEQHRQEALEAGADLHVAKPITAISLIAGIDEAIRMTAGPQARLV
jgi:CheY-like chemotaxis protein